MPATAMNVEVPREELVKLAGLGLAVTEMIEDAAGTCPVVLGDWLQDQLRPLLAPADLEIGDARGEHFAAASAAMKSLSTYAAYKAFEFETRNKDEEA